MFECYNNQKMDAVKKLKKNSAMRKIMQLIWTMWREENKEYRIKSNRIKYTYICILTISDNIVLVVAIFLILII